MHFLSPERRNSLVEYLSGYLGVPRKLAEDCASYTLQDLDRHLSPIARLLISEASKEEPFTPERQIMFEANRGIIQAYREELRERGMELEDLPKTAAILDSFDADSKGRAVN